MPNNIILNEDESLIKIIRQPGTKLFISLIIPIILIILPFFFLYPLFSKGQWGMIAFFSSLTVGLIWLLRNTLIWSWQTLTITNQRVIDIDQTGIFHQIVSDIPLSKIQDVFYEVKGLTQTITHTGNINIVLNDNKTKIEAIGIAQPRKIQQLILQLKAETLKDKLDATQLSAEELVNLVKKIKAGLGEVKFKEFLLKLDDEKVEND